MKITFDPAKREKTLAERGLDFADASIVFKGIHFTFEDKRKDYGEIRYISIGKLRGRMVVVVWTKREDTRRIISMRNANEREQARFANALG